MRMEFKILLILLCLTFFKSYQLNAKIGKLLSWKLQIAIRTSWGIWNPKCLPNPKVLHLQKKCCLGQHSPPPSLRHCSLPITRRKKDLAKQVHEVPAFAMISVLLFMGMILRVSSLSPFVWFAMDFKNNKRI